MIPADPNEIRDPALERIVFSRRLVPELLAQVVELAHVFTVLLAIASAQALSVSCCDNFCLSEANF